MKTTIILILLLLTIVSEISASKDENKRETLTKKLSTPKCSADQACSPGRVCVPFISKCSGEGHEKCFTDDHCPGDQICSIFIGFCLTKPKCDNTKPYSYCMKGMCPCPQGYECKGKPGFQKCLPEETGYDKGTYIVN
ncbi:uncharacterized protein LOC114521711 [Dendronephthya gigantea]|uniref:uncharacterized protein LOC114521711 n=1 Tax=Dendronephthya gigantea TaxID=151771 RepID=UPI00106AF50F|nr:uncharacterized protein LOC114521711 [Dendronephthya gigantea]